MSAPRWAARRAKKVEGVTPFSSVQPVAEVVEKTGRSCSDSSHHAAQHETSVFEVGHYGTKSHSSDSPVPLVAPKKDTTPAPRTKRCLTQMPSIMPGCLVQHRVSGRQGVVEFTPVGSSKVEDDEVLVHMGSNRHDLTSLVWTPVQDLQVVDTSQCRMTERADVQAYRHAIQAIELTKTGASVSEVSSRLGRSEAWVRQKVSIGDVSKVQKPKGMEWWDPKGFCDVTYLRRYSHGEGLYEDIVQGVEWEQDRVWRVRKQEGSSNWHLRTVKECPGNKGVGFCGRSLQKVPDDTYQIGPQDSRHAARTRPHGNWSCELAALNATTCVKPCQSSPIPESYWWCSKCRWYVCSTCVDAMPDKATSKQVAPWRSGECPRLDALVKDIVRDFCLPDPQQQNYTIKMNWYPDEFSRVSPHRHDNWTLLLSLGTPRVLTVDRANVLMEDGDVILFGTQSHGVPEMPGCAGGRLSLVFMFSPDATVGTAASARVLAGKRMGRRGQQVAGLPRRQLLEDVDWKSNFGNWVAANDEISDSVATLCALGFHHTSCQSALEAADGDVEQAAAILLAAAA